MKFTVIVEVTVTDGPKRLELADVAEVLESELDALTFDVDESVCETSALSVIPL